MFSLSKSRAYPRASSLLLTIFVVSVSRTASAQHFDTDLESPDHNIRFSIDADGVGALRYEVVFDKHAALEPSVLGVSVNGQDLGKDAVMGKAKRSAKKENYPIFGAHRTALNSYNELDIPFMSGAQKTPWQLEVRAFNDGVAYRYRVPGQGTRHIDGEMTSWSLNPASVCWYQTDTGAYEGLWQEKTVDKLAAGTNVAAPVTVKLPNGLGYAMLTEANLVGYSDMALEVTKRRRYDEAAPFNAIFDKNPNGWDTEGEIVTPWRVTLLSSDLNGLVNSDILRNLCPPPAPELVNAKWIKPGRALWHWMVTGRPKLQDQRQWVDWTKQIGFEYYLIDDGWKNWRAEGKDQWACLKDVVDYAKTQGVGIFAWVNSNEVFSPSDRAAYLQKAKAAGLVGLKIDFMRPADPTWVQWYNDTLRDMAQAELMVDFHGAVKPTGRDRTWPNELTREAIRGREVFKQPSLHDAALPFTRFVQGSADFTPTEFRANKLGRSTWAHELAQAVIYTSPFLCYSGSPDSYLANPALDLMRVIPSTWDETIVLPGSEIGDMALFARRKGNEWFLAGLNGGCSNEGSCVASQLDSAAKYPSFARTAKFDLGFLGKGNYRLDLWADANESPTAWGHSQHLVTRKNDLAITMRPDGGFVARLTRAQ